MTLEEIISGFKCLQKKEQEAFQAFVLRSVQSDGKSVEQYTEEERFSKGWACPYCGSIHVVRNGRCSTGTQRFLCRDCKKSFSAASNSVLSGTHKDLSVWKKYIECMTAGLSIRKSAEICGIHRDTSFVWRHKILDAMRSVAEKVKLNGIVEADETSFVISYKGNHFRSKRFQMHRPAHKRGKSVHSGSNTFRVIVPCAVNRNGQAIAKVAGSGSATVNKLDLVFDDRIESGTTLVTDAWKSYVLFCKEHNLNLVQVKGGKAKKGIYHIQHVNNYHSQLKKFIRQFNGVSSKYLENYLVWHNYLNYAKETLTEKQQIFQKLGLTTVFKVTFKSLPIRPPIPDLEMQSMKINKIL